MKIIADLHTHTIKCGHAYSSLQEMAQGAKDNGIEIMATTDHGPNMPGAADLTYFEDLIQIPEKIAGTRVLKGAESNIIGPDGQLDIPDRVLARLELVLVGFHPRCGYQGQSVEDHTRAMMGAIENPLVDLVVHPGNPMFPINISQVIKAAKENDVIIEINNSSFRGSRKGSRENCSEIAVKCRQEGIMVSADSDSHLSFDVGRLDRAIKLIKEAGIRPEQVINTSKEDVLAFVDRKLKVKKEFLEGVEL